MNLILHGNMLQSFFLVPGHKRGLVFNDSIKAACHMCWGFPGGSVVKNSPAMWETQETWAGFVGWEDPLE